MILDRLPDTLMRRLRDASPTVATELARRLNVPIGMVADWANAGAITVKMAGKLEETLASIQQEAAR